MSNKQFNTKALWKFQEGFIISTFLILTGWVFELIKIPSPAMSTTYPYNRIIALSWIIGITVLFIVGQKTRIIQWLSTIPAAVTSTMPLLLLSLLLGFFPQAPSTDNELINRLGLDHITISWPFIIASLWLLLCLQITIIKRLNEVGRRKWGFVINHLGIFIALSAGIFGYPELERLQLTAMEGRTIWMAKDKDQKLIEVPLALKLLDFNIDYFAPKLAIVDNKEGTILKLNGKPQYAMMDTDSITIANYTILINKHYSKAAKVGNNYHPVSDIGSAPAARCSVKWNNDQTEGWLFCGSLRFDPEALKINEKHSLIMMPPEPRRYYSDIAIVTPQKTRDTLRIEVNHPASINGYKIYQMDYDKEMGEWSNKTVLELVRDPWLPVVYAGIFLMMIGAIILFWQGSFLTSKKRRDDELD